MKNLSSGTMSNIVVCNKEKVGLKHGPKEGAVGAEKSSAV